MVDLIIEPIAFLVTGVGIPIYQKINKYIKDKKSDKKNAKALKSMKEDKEAIEKYLLPLISDEISRFSPQFDQILLLSYNKEKLIETLNLIFRGLITVSPINKEIQEKKKNYKINGKLNNFNILLIGKNDKIKNSLIKSILQLDNQTIELEKIIDESNKDFVFYTNKELRIFDCLEIKKESFQIDNIFKLIKNSMIKDDINDFFHCILYLLEGEKFEENDEHNIKELMKFNKDYILPIIIINPERNTRGNQEEISNKVNYIIKGNKSIFYINTNYKKIIEENTLLFVENNINDLKKICLEKKNIFCKSSYFLENKKKAECENEINQKKYEIEKTIEKRINSFLVGNEFSNLYLLNKQIVSTIIYKLFKVKKIDKKLQKKIYNLFKNYLDSIERKFDEFYENYLGNSIKLISKYKEENKNNKEKGDKEDIDIQKENFQYINEEFFLKENENDGKNGRQNKFIDKVHNLYNDEIIKRASFFIDNKINEILSNLLIESFNK